MPSPAGFDPRRPTHWLACAGGAGLLPRAPGTWGTLAAVPLYLLLAGLPLALYLGLVALLFGLGVWVCDRVSRDLGDPDPPAIVWDEVVGFLLTLTAVPLDWRWVLAGFLLFRLADILKPWPIALIERRLGGGLGIMLDDAAAGVLAWIGMQGLIWVAG